MKIFIPLIVIVIGMRGVAIPLWEGWNEKQDRRRDSWQMARIAAFINHERRFNRDETLQEILMRAKWGPGVAYAQLSSEGWNEIECQEVPLNNQVGNLKRVDYILVKKSSRFGLLSDGRFIYKPFDLDALAEGSSMTYSLWWW